ncbi:hypothetical protein [uncultured Nostoc sp.]|uniref:hypothetical protein n=1 Tax=uncultured Nostoc sp. TaxID=340711 RepID=UPI0035C9FD98
MKPFDITLLEELTTKQKLASLFDISIRSVYSYDAIARANLPEYMEDYPVANGKPITRYPLTRYQCWILGKIAWHLRLFSVKELTYFLAEDYEFAVKFSKEEFEKLNKAQITLSIYQKS